MKPETYSARLLKYLDIAMETVEDKIADCNDEPIRKRVAESFLAGLKTAKQIALDVQDTTN
jgi:hypothetical protein